jgi:hypothetical protein
MPNSATAELGGVAGAAFGEGAANAPKAQEPQNAILESYDNSDVSRFMESIV